MVRVFYSQKTEYLINMHELTQLRNHYHEKLNRNYNTSSKIIEKIITSWKS